MASHVSMAGGFSECAGSVLVGPVAGLSHHRCCSENQAFLGAVVRSDRSKYYDVSPNYKAHVIM